MNKVNEFWKEYVEKNGIDEKYTSAYFFGGDEKMAWDLLELVVQGKKKATTSLMQEYVIEQEEIPKVGQYFVIVDFNFNPYAIIKNTNIRVMKFKDMTYDICKLEGEDDNLESWRNNHIKMFTEIGKEVGYIFNEEMEIVFEEFELVYSKS